MSIVLALIAMVMLARFYPPLNIAFYTYLGGALIGFVGTLLFSTSVPSALQWGALAGIGSALGAWLLYQELSRAPFAIVVPVSAVAMVNGHHRPWALAGSLVRATQCLGI